MHRGFLLALLSIPVGVTADERLTLLQKGKEVEVRIDGSLFTKYRSNGAVPCLYPLLAPSGAHGTRRFPFEKDVAGEQSDHPHHTGFWFAHGDVNGLDFWHARQGESVVTRSLDLDPKVLDEDSETESVSFSADLEWMDGEGLVLLEETRHYRISLAEATRMITVTSHLTASEKDVRFGDSKEGSIAVRVAPTLRLKGKVGEGQIENSEGVGDENVWGKRANWVAYHGPDSSGDSMVIALMDHPENLRHPTWWHARDYGLLAANPFGTRAFGDADFPTSGDFVLKKGDSLKLKHLLLIQSGDFSRESLTEVWETFSSPVKPR